eukprot:Hpha_TRINITY_DN16360_c2_g1::TRINITY_DN16360_c2_g1_i1::g.58267::m.58267
MICPMPTSIGHVVGVPTGQWHAPPPQGQYMCDPMSSTLTPYALATAEHFVGAGQMMPRQKRGRRSGARSIQSVPTRIGEMASKAENRSNWSPGHSSVQGSVAGRTTTTLRGSAWTAGSSSDDEGAEWTGRHSLNYVLRWIEDQWQRHGGRQQGMFDQWDLAVTDAFRNWRKRPASEADARSDSRRVVSVAQTARSVVSREELAHIQRFEGEEGQEVDEEIDEDEPPSLSNYSSEVEREEEEEEAEEEGEEDEQQVQTKKS